MTTTRIIKIVDRFALSLMNTIVFVGLPVVALGVITQRL